MEKINVPVLNEQWTDWHWQQKHRIRDIDTFERLLGIRFGPQERAKLDETIKKFPLSITPYYLSLIDTEDYENDPVYKQCFPDPRELTVKGHEMSDPLAEESDSPVPYLTHRYPDRVLLHVSNVCAMYCRHCTRKRKVGDVDDIPDKESLEKAIAYIKKTSRVRDVLLSGGDPLMLSDGYLDWILTELRKIDHVEVIRIGTRAPVVLPYRITDDLVDILKKHHPVWLNTHFNHPREITSASGEALAKLANAGIPLGNQSVLLSGINDCPIIMKKLVQLLVKNRVRPYYLYQCDLSEGLTHFRTSVGKGIEIIENLIGHTSGFAVPTYVIDAPGGGGKIPVMPNYLISWSDNKVILRNYEGIITTYREPDDYQAVPCEKACDTCSLRFNVADLDEKPGVKAVGISRLLSDYNEDISLIPENNIRLKRRQVYENDNP
ncbi:MAG TPA: lysine 2,3-aminomutase [Clostridiales bacterium]|nr:lysine 2,3-aminomutase [Clostridiales bacterium]